MPKTTFVRKPCTLDDVRNRAAHIKERHGGEALDSYYVAEEIQLGENAFFELNEDLVSDRDWCREFSNRLHPMRDGAVPAIRVSCRAICRQASYSISSPVSSSFIRSPSSLRGKSR